MSKFKEAAEGIKNFAGRLRGFMETAEFLEKIGDLELAETEALNRRDSALQQEADAQASLSRVLDDVLKAEEAVKTATETAANLESASREKADQIIADAKKQGQRAIADLNLEIAGIKNQIMVENQNLDSVKNDVEEKKKELSECEEKVKDAKASIKKMLEA